MSEWSVYTNSEHWFEYNKEQLFHQYFFKNSCKSLTADKEPTNIGLF